MGIFDKMDTKRRVQPATGPLNEAFVTPLWLTGGGIPVAALLRSAAFKRDLAGMKSELARGRRAYILIDPSPKRATRLMVSTDDLKTWKFRLGGKTDRGWAIDWEIAVQISGAQVTVSTLRYLMNDGELAKGDFHDAMRTDILRTLATGNLARAGAEEEISAQSLNVALMPDPVPTPLDQSFKFQTVAEVAQLHAALGLLGHRVKRTEGGYEWSVGLPSEGFADSIAGTFTSGAIEFAAHISSSNPLSRRVASHAIPEFIHRALFIVQTKDPEAKYEGPQEWAS